MFMEDGAYFQDIESWYESVELEHCGGEVRGGGQSGNTVQAETLVPARV